VTGPADHATRGEHPVDDVEDWTDEEWARRDDPVPIPYEGGPLDGELNEYDYLLEEMEPGQVFDWPTRGTGRGGVGPADTRERYVLEHRGPTRRAGWAWVHTGQVVPPVEDQAFEALVVGGPRDGERIYLLGTARRDVGARVDHHVRGCVLQHAGDDPTDGWTLRFQEQEAPR
jgi:hypothetical protein